MGFHGQLEMSGLGCPDLAQKERHKNPAPRPMRPGFTREPGWECGPASVSRVCPRAQLEGPAYVRGQPRTPVTARLSVADSPTAGPGYLPCRISPLRHISSIFYSGGTVLASGLNEPPRSGTLRWGKKAGEGAPPGAPAHRRQPDAQENHLVTLSNCQFCKEFIEAARAHVGEFFSMPSSAVGSVVNDKEAVYCYLFIPPSMA